MTDSQEEQQTTGSRWGTHIAVAAAAVAVGFSAVYLTSQPAANPEAAKVTATTSPSNKATAQPNATPAKPVTLADLKILPQGPGKNALSVGDMAMFVFKEPHTLPDLTFQADGGTEKTFADWRGKVVLVNLWATWCAPCRKEMPDLDQLQKALGGDDFEVVAVSLDRGSGDRPKKFLSEINVTNLAFYHDPTTRLGHKLQAIGMPATLLLDREGREIGRLIGPADWDSEDALRLIRTVIERTDPSTAQAN